MTTEWMAIVIVVHVIGALWFGWMILDAHRVAAIVATETTENSDEKAKSAFLDLLRAAKKEMIVYDDGDANPGSIYEDENIVKAVKQKIKDNPKFHMDCVFNKDEETLFRRRLADVSGVQIRKRETNPKRIHYKIIDGRTAYVSVHEEGSAERLAKTIECKLFPLTSRAPELRHYFKDFDSYA